MIKFFNTHIVFQEIPNMVSLAINITNCQHTCDGCHSPYLRMDIGEELSFDKLNELMLYNNGIDCVIFMGDGNDKNQIIELAKKVKYNNLLVALYTGDDFIYKKYYDVFDYIKTGKFIKERGGLNSKGTNQKLYQKIDGEFRELIFKHKYVK